MKGTGTLKCGFLCGFLLIGCAIRELCLSHFVGWVYSPTASDVVSETVGEYTHPTNAEVLGFV